MQQQIRLLFDVYLAMGVVIQLAMLYLQGAALRRHGNSCFVFLVIGTLSGIVVLAINGALLAFRHTETSVFWCYSLNLFFGALQGCCTVVGAAFLFRDYRLLAECLSAAPVTSDTGSHGSQAESQQ